MVTHSNPLMLPNDESMTASQLANDNQSVPRRTRKNVVQSKHGCLTCKARRVKCDEEKPVCRECRRLDKVCGGYPAQVPKTKAGVGNPKMASYYPSGANHLIPPAPYLGHSPNAVSGGHLDVSEQTRFSLLGCEILGHSAYTNINSLSQSVWQHLLPQLCYGNSLVHAAAAAFGATYAWRGCSSETDAMAQSAVSQYNWAIKSLRHETDTMSDGPLPLLLACVLLASAELLQRRQYNALTHLQGAFQIMSLHEHKLPSRPPDEASSGTVSVVESSKTFLSWDDALILLFQCLDVQLASYRFTCPPHLRYARDIWFDGQAGTFHTVKEAYLRLVPTLNACYRFIATARPYKYREQVFLPPEVLIEQGRHAALLDQWLLNLDNQILDQRSFASNDVSAESRCLARILRSQCTSTVVNLYTAVNPREATYDVHAPRFQQIIIDAAQVLDQMLTSSANPTHFSLGLGVAEALFLTACKYRHPVFRRRAIDLLGKVGREGPWEGKILAAVATRIVEIEEQQLLDSQSASPEDIDEHCRIHSCMMAESQSGTTVVVDFSRCRSVTDLVDNNTSTTDEEDIWERWSETLTITGS